MACGDCRYWEARNTHRAYGLCRFNAPAPMLVEENDDEGERWAVWPTTSFDEMCGQFKNRKDN